MRSYNQSNELIKWLVILGDFVLLNAIILAGAWHSWRVEHWPDRGLEIFILVNNIALILSQLRYCTIIHQRLVSSGDIVQRTVGLSALQCVLAFVLVRVFDYHLPVKQKVVYEFGSFKKNNYLCTR